MPELFLVAGGKRYSGWKSIRVTRSIESLAGSFALEVSDRWGGQNDPWPIAEEDACRVEIDKQVVIDGYVDKRSLSASATSRSLSYTGRDRAAALVDCSLLVSGASVAGHKWSYRNLDIAQFATEIAAPHGIAVSVQAGLVLKKDPLLVAHPGETGFEAIKRAAGSAAVLVVSDGAGGILITRSATTRAAPLIEASNIETASVEYDGTDRFRRYLISSQVPGTDEASGEATRIQAEATDEGVRRPGRVLLIRPDKGYSTADARRRADWEARNRAARAETVTIGVQGWTQPNGQLWPLNALSRVRAPRLIGVDGDMLISQVEYSIGDNGGQITQMHLVRPDAFEPEPQAVVSGSKEALWLVSDKHGQLVEPGKR
jgi:prophage tail gpP-like protein